jgi:hypothetical protein
MLKNDLSKDPFDCFQSDDDRKLLFLGYSFSEETLMHRRYRLWLHLVRMSKSFSEMDAKLNSYLVGYPNLLDPKSDLMRQTLSQASLTAYRTLLSVFLPHGRYRLLECPPYIDEISTAYRALDEDMLTEKDGPKEVLLRLYSRWSCFVEEAKVLHMSLDNKFVKPILKCHPDGGADLLLQVLSLDLMCGECLIC